MAAARSSSSITFCGACWPDSGEMSRGSVQSPKAFSKRVISCPCSPVQKMTSWAWSTGTGAIARSRSASPQRRRCSMVRTLVVFARGRSGSSDVRGSTRSTSMPRRPSSIAAASPLGPPPAISTGTWVGTSVIGSPVGQVEVQRGLEAVSTLVPVAVGRSIRGRRAVRGPGAIGRQPTVRRAAISRWRAVPATAAPRRGRSRCRAARAGRCARGTAEGCRSRGRPRSGGRARR